MARKSQPMIDHLAEKFPEFDGWDYDRRSQHVVFEPGREPTKKEWSKVAGVFDVVSSHGYSERTGKAWIFIPETTFDEELEALDDGTPEKEDNQQ